MADGGRASRSEVRSYVTGLDREQREFLLEQSRTVLEAHGEIQQEHRGQANRLLRAYVGAIGLLVAAITFASSGARRLDLPAVQERSVTNPRVLKLLVIIAVIAVGALLVARAFLRFAGVIEIVVQVLTPEQIDSDSWVSRLFSAIPFYPGEAPPDDKFPFHPGAREGIRRVPKARELTDIARHPEFAEVRVLTDRLMRAQANENVINYNMRQLSRVYDIISQSLVDVLLGAVLLTAGFVALTTT